MKKNILAILILNYFPLNMIDCRVGNDGQCIKNCRDYGYDGLGLGLGLYGGYGLGGSYYGYNDYDRYAYNGLGYNYGGYNNYESDNLETNLVTGGLSDLTETNNNNNYYYSDIIIEE